MANDAAQTTPPSFAKRMYDGIASITVGDIVTYSVPTASCLAILWFLIEPVIAGQISRTFDKYGVSKETFTKMSDQVDGLSAQNEELKGIIGSLRAQQTTTASQNRAILRALQELNLRVNVPAE